MQRRWQHRGWLLAALMLGACSADTGSTEEDKDPSESDAVGGLSLALTSVDSQGRSYRLREATFTVNQAYWWYYDGGVAAPATELSTEDDPNSDRLTVRLVPGEYTVSLGGDWYLERLGANGPERVQQAVLLSEAVQYAYIGNGWNSDLDYRFGVDGTLIDFRHGDLNIDISVELPGEDPYPSYDGGGPFPITDGGVIVRDAGMAFPLK